MQPQAKTIRLPHDLAERLRTAAFVHRRPQTAIVVDAITDYLDRLEGQSSKDRG